MDIQNKNIDGGKAFDWGRTSEDYAKFRDIYPEAFYQAFDVFVFPSRYEGLPGTVIEAQTAGVPCLMSDKITKEAAVTDLVRVCKLDKSADIWADEACDLYGMWKEKYGDKGHASRIDDLKKAGFDVKTEAVRLEELYAKLLNDSGINRQ